MGAGSPDAGIPILMYHEVAEPSEVPRLATRINDSYIVTSDQFREHLDALRDGGCAIIGLPELATALRDCGTLPARAVVISFDDGYEGNFRNAVPLLQEYGATATFFLATARIGDECMLDWSQVAEMARAGMTIGSHTATHPLLSTLNEEQTTDEFARSAHDIEVHVGRRPRFFSLPNGDSNRWYRPAVRAQGYEAGCGSEPGLNSRGQDMLMLRRIAIKKSMPASQVLAFASADAAALSKLRRHAQAKRLVTRLLGKKLYDWLYNRIFGVTQPAKGAS